MSLAAYLRVSTGDQDSALQREAIERYAAARGAEVVCYEDHGVSGATASRPGLDRLMAEVRRGRVRHVVVWKIDRLSRSVLHLLHALEEFRSRGVAFTSLTEGIDTSTPMGRALYGVVGVLAELEREGIRERVRAGMAAAKRRGVQLGRRRVLMPGQVDRALEWVQAEGVSVRQAARRLHVPRPTLIRYLRARGVMSKKPASGSGPRPANSGTGAEAG